MTKEKKELLMRYLCSMLPYGLMVQKTDNEGVAVDCRLVEVFNDGNTCNLALFNGKRNCVSGLENIKPYLRRMTSMTEEEHDEYRKILCGFGFTEFYKTADKLLVWLHEKRLDYHHMIEDGSALEAKEGMYNKDMIQEEKELLLEDICGRLPYGVKILYKGWDSDHGCEFNTVEDLIGIDDKFIYTLWRGERDKHSIVEPLSITDYKPYLRPLSSMTEEERKELKKLMNCDCVTDYSLEYTVGGQVDYDDFLVYYEESSKLIDCLNKKMFDYRGLIPKGLALEAKDGMYNN